MQKYNKAIWAFISVWLGEVAVFVMKAGTPSLDALARYETWVLAAFVALVVYLRPNKVVDAMGRPVNVIAVAEGQSK